MEELEKLAILDLGTNTFHLLIAEMNDRDEFVVREKYKIPVKLGEDGLTSGQLSEKAFERGIRGLRRIKKLIDTKKANKVLAFATSAIRSASNGKEFIRQAKAESGINIRIINGNEEASLIYEGVKNGLQLPFDEECLIVDIGGGSVEFIVTRENKPLLLRSLDIGAARMKEHQPISDPITPEEIKKLQAWLREEMKGLLKELKEFHITTLIGSSGTFETLGALVALRNQDEIASTNLNSYAFQRGDLEAIHHQLMASTHAERSAMPGIEPMRVDMIVPGSVLVDLVLKELKMEKVMISTFALKEGIFYRYLEEKRERVSYQSGNASRSVRNKAVKILAKKYGIDSDHGLKVSDICATLFDLLHPLHNQGENERELLRYAAMLHDVGYFIQHSGHHKHGQYIIMNSALNGFSSDELLLMGNVVRYHRKSLPTRDHYHFKILSKPHRFVIRLMAGILRIGDNLDRGHRGLVDNVWVTVEPRTLHLFVESTETVDIEITAANENKELLEQVLGRKIVIQQV